MESQEGEIVFNPVTQEPVKDPTLAKAIQEESHYITRRGKPRVVIDWAKFMKLRRGYKGVPKYFGLTDREVQTYMKISREALVPIQIIARVWGMTGKLKKQIVEFCNVKKIPVYRWPGKHEKGYFVFSGDIVRAIESCQIDMEADGGAWGKMMEARWEKNRRAGEKARANRRLRRDQPDPDQAQTPATRARGPRG